MPQASQIIGTQASVVTSRFCCCKQDTEDLGNQSWENRLLNKFLIAPLKKIIHGNAQSRESQTHQVNKSRTAEEGDLGPAVPEQPPSVGAGTSRQLQKQVPPSPGSTMLVSVSPCLPSRSRPLAASCLPSKQDCSNPYRGGVLRNQRESTVRGGDRQDSGGDHSFWGARAPWLTYWKTDAGSLDEQFHVSGPNAHLVYEAL